jgi:hypothetical protein
MSYEEEDTSMSYAEEEDACMSYEEVDTCMSHEEEDTYLEDQITGRSVWRNAVPVTSLRSAEA